jgi:hypothetical protein
LLRYGSRRPAAEDLRGQWRCSAMQRTSGFSSSLLIRMTLPDTASTGTPPIEPRASLRDCGAIGHEGGGYLESLRAIGREPLGTSAQLAAVGHNFPAKLLVISKLSRNASRTNKSSTRAPEARHYLGAWQPLFPGIWRLRNVRYAFSIIHCGRASLLPRQSAGDAVRYRASRILDSARTRYFDSHLSSLRTRSPDLQG